MLLGEITLARLSHKEAVLMRELMDRGLSSRERLAQHLFVYDARGKDPPFERSVLNTMISEVRKKLCPGWKILPVPTGWGWRLVQTE